MYDLHYDLINRHLSGFKQSLKGGVGKELNHRKGRLNIRALARRDDSGFFLRTGKTEDGKPTITFIVDCSGSMSGEPMEMAIQMCVILSSLHESNAANVNVICTGHSRADGTGYNGFQVPMPQPPKVWQAMQAWHGREGLSQTFDKFKNVLAKSDLVACYTDADIADKALKPSLWNKHGISCVGLYCGALSQVDVMRRYFDYAIARTTPDDLFTSFLELVKRLLKVQLRK